MGVGGSLERVYQGGGEDVVARIVLRGCGNIERVCY